ncbi:MAG: M42 family metallopeptidase [Clostridia bacterium]|nr:M42 family metallopeptidase [Clostridia bacterium]
MDNTKLNSYVDYILEQLKTIIAIDSPTCYTENAAKAVAEELTRLGYAPERTVKGGVIVDLGGKPENGILVETHLDTLGAMVVEVKGNGRLKMTPLGGLSANNVETEDVRVVTRSGKTVTGTIQLSNASVHVNGSYNSTVRSFDNIEVVLDEDVRSAGDAAKLGIRVGDIVCVEPRLKITDTGYIKSRFLDDKLSVAILLGYAKYLKDEGIAPDRRVYGHITVYEEIGHGGSASVPAGVTEGLSVDMGCVGGSLACTEKQVSICAKDSGGPYNYEVVTGLINAAEKMEADYAVDIYPYYGSDVEATLRAGWDIKHGLIGAGVYASHGYERSHRDGVLNTLKVLIGYIG